MTLKSYLWGIRILSIISLSALTLVIYGVNPKSSGLLGPTLFYLTLFFSLSGIFNLFLTWSRKVFLGKEVAEDSIFMSFRQGVLLSAISVVLLFFQSQRMLTWWDGLLVVAGVFLIELYFLSRE